MNHNFGNNLKRLRTAKNYTQEQAAQLLNISPKSLSRWECGSTMPDVMMLPEIARLYCVTIDDLFKEQSIAYENYAGRLLSVYEATRDINDFYHAEREFARLRKSKNYTINDLCSYGILYQYHMSDCKEAALRLFEQGLAMGPEDDPDTYHQIERQRMLLLSQTGENERNIAEQTAKLEEHPHDFYCHMNLLVAYLYAYGGDLYKRLKMHDEAFTCWDKTLELDPEMTAALWSKAFCHEELGNYKAAYEVWVELMELLEARGYEAEVAEPRRLAERCRERMQA